MLVLFAAADPWDDRRRDRARSRTCFYAQTTVVIVPQRIPQSYVRSTVTLSIAERLASTSQQILSRNTLEPLINELDVFPALRTRMPMEPLIIWFRRGVTIRMATADSFVIGYGGYDPVRVQKIAERLAELFIRESVKEREMLADSTSQFLETELKAASVRLQAQEKRVEEYRRRYAGQLPSQLEANLRILQGTSAQLTGLVESLNRERARREEILRDLSNIAPPPLRLLNGRARGHGRKRIDDRHPAAGERSSARRPALATSCGCGSPPSIRTWSVSRTSSRGSRRPPRAPAPSEPTQPIMSAREALRETLKVVENQIGAAGSRKEAARRHRHLPGRVSLCPSASPMGAVTRDTADASRLLRPAREARVRIVANLERQQVGEQFGSSSGRSSTAPVSPNRPLIDDRVAIGARLGLTLLVIRELRDRGLHAEGETACVSPSSARADDCHALGSPADAPAPTALVLAALAVVVVVTTIRLVSEADVYLRLACAAPFKLTPDPAPSSSTDQHQAALSSSKCTFTEGKGLTVLTGEAERSNDDRAGPRSCVSRQWQS